MGEQYYNSFVGSVNAALDAAVEVFKEHLAARGTPLSEGEIEHLQREVFNRGHEAADPDDPEE